MSTESKLILLVDDDSALTLLLANMLREKGLRVEKASNGQEGVKKAKELSPDVIFMDVNMPVMNGFDACRQIKQDPDTAIIPLIFITSMGNDNDRINGFDCGGDDYIIKPVNHQEVFVRLKHYLNKKSEKVIAEEINHEADRFRQAMAELLEDSDFDKKKDAVDKAILHMDNIIKYCRQNNE